LVAVVAVALAAPMLRLEAGLVAAGVAGLDIHFLPFSPLT
jgi:hypothetical protein